MEYRKMWTDLNKTLRGRKTTILVVVIAALTAWAGTMGPESWLVANLDWLRTALGSLAFGTAAAKLSRPRGMTP